MAKSYLIGNSYLKNLLATINETEVLPDINEFVQQIFLIKDTDLDMDTLCVEYFKRHQFGFQCLRCKLNDFDVSEELAKILFKALLEKNYKEAVAVFDHLGIIKRDLQVVLLPLLIEHQVKLFKENIRVRFENNATNRLLGDYRTRLIDALVREAL